MSQEKVDRYKEQKKNRKKIGYVEINLHTLYIYIFNINLP